MKIRTVVVDDEKPARDRIKRFLAEHSDFEVVGEAGDGESAVRVIREQKPDLVFLDVRMPEANGFEVLENLEDPPRVVFATAYERYAVQAFEVHSIDYLLKPFDRKRFAATVGRVREEMRKSAPTEQKLDALLQEIRESTRALQRASAPGAGPIVDDARAETPAREGRPELRSGSKSGAAEPGVAPQDPAGARAVDDGSVLSTRADTGAAVSGGRTEALSTSRPLSASDRIPGKRGPRIYLLAPQEILWFEADGELVFARASAHRYLVSRTLTELEAALDPRVFFRSHRSFIVNLSAIGEIVPEDSGNYRILMRDADRTAVPLSRRQARKLRDVFPW